MIVGMLMMPNLLATPGFSSTLSLPMHTLSPYSWAISSMIGPTMRHGPHQGAQKSTIMGVGALPTSSSNVASVRVFTSLATWTPPWRGGDGPAAPRRSPGGKRSEDPDRRDVRRRGRQGPDTHDCRLLGALVRPVPHGRPDHRRDRPGARRQGVHRQAKRRREPRPSK